MLVKGKLLDENLLLNRVPVYPSPFDKTKLMGLIPLHIRRVQSLSPIYKIKFSALYYITWGSGKKQQKQEKRNKNTNI